MRLQLIFTTLLFSLSSFATSDKEVSELFFKYDAIMGAQKVELIDEVFTEKFLKEVGGKAEFIENLKELPKQSEKSLNFSKMTWRKGVKDEIYFARKSTPSSTTKNKEKADHSGASFILVREDGKLKINGTMSDGH